MHRVAGTLPIALAPATGGRLPAVRVEIDSCAVRFETDCPPALQSLDGLLREVFTGRYFEFAVAPADLRERLPILRYLDRASYETVYEAEADVCTFQAPWADIQGSTLLAMWLHLLSELVRQRRGEYLLHASAVVRQGRAVVLFGHGEAGKTICALDLCLRHGFELFANNRVKVGVGDGGVQLLKGDPVFRLRFSSLVQYSEPLAQQLFAGTAVDQPAWQRKQTVDPEVLGVRVASTRPRVSAFVLLTLDAESNPSFVQEIRTDARSHDAFFAMADVARGISDLIRGASFVPLLDGHGFRDVYVPCLNSPELVRCRVAFMKTLFFTSHVLKIRAPLNQAVATILQSFDAGF